VPIGEGPEPTTTPTPYDNVYEFPPMPGYGEHGPPSYGVGIPPMFWPPWWWGKWYGGFPHGKKDPYGSKEPGPHGDQFPVYGPRPVSFELFIYTL